MGFFSFYSKHILIICDHGCKLQHKSIYNKQTLCCVVLNVLKLGYNLGSDGKDYELQTRRCVSCIPDISFQTQAARWDFFSFPIIHLLLALCHFKVKSISIRSPLLLASTYTSAEYHAAHGSWRGGWHVRGANFRAPSLRRELVRSAAMCAGEKDLIVSEGDCCPHYSSTLLLSFSLM